MASNGEVWLANLNPVKKNNEMGKVGPVLILQNDTLNQSGYKTTIVIPFSTVLIDDAEPIRMRIQKREKLESDSDLIVTQTRAIENSRLVEKLGSLSKQEMKKVKALLLEVID